MEDDQDVVKTLAAYMVHCGVYCVVAALLVVWSVMEMVTPNPWLVVFFAMNMVLMLINLKRFVVLKNTRAAIIDLRKICKKLEAAIEGANAEGGGEK